MNLQDKRALVNSIYQRIQREARQTGWEEPPDRRHLITKHNQAFSLDFGSQKMKIADFENLLTWAPGRFVKGKFKPLTSGTLKQYLHAPGKTMAAELEDGRSVLITRTR